MTTQQFSNFWAWRRSLTGIALAAGLLSWGTASVVAAPVVTGGTDPYAWYRADTGVVDSSGTVTEWQDQSGNNRHLNGTEIGKSIVGAPQLTNNGAFGQQVVTFDGDDYFSARADSNWGHAGNGWVFSVWQRTGGEGAVYGAQAGGARQKLDTRDNELDPPIGAAISVFACCGPPQSSFISDTVGQNNYAVVAVDHVAGSPGDRIRINGTGISTGGLDSQGMDGVVIGDFKNLNGGWNGDIAEVIIFDGNLSLSEVSQIEQALTARWLVPEPSTLGILFVSLLGLVFRPRHRGR